MIVPLYPPAELEMVELLPTILHAEFINVTLWSAVHFEKASLPNVATLAGRTTEPSDTHDVKAFIWISVTLSAMVNDARLAHPIKEYVPILVIPFSITTDVIRLLYLFHGTFSLESQLEILPLPEIVSFPPSSVQFAFVPQVPDSVTFSAEMTDVSILVCTAPAGTAVKAERQIAAETTADKNFFIFYSSHFNIPAAAAIYVQAAFITDTANIHKTCNCIPCSCRS